MLSNHAEKREAPCRTPVIPHTEASHRKLVLERRRNSYSRKFTQDLYIGSPPRKLMVDIHTPKLITKITHKTNAQKSRQNLTQLDD